MTEADLYMGVDMSPPPRPAEGVPWYITVPAGFVALIAVLRTVKAIARSGSRYENGAQL